MSDEQIPRATVELWLERILGHEGGYSKDPRDPGNWTGGKVGKGELRGTKYGVAANTYPKLDIKNLTISQAAAIYECDYLQPLKAHQYPHGVAFQLFDTAINSGVDRANKILQKAANVLPDGKIGPITLAAVHSFEDHELVLNVIAERLEFMTKLRNWPAHGKGWARRIARNMKLAALDT